MLGLRLLFQVAIGIRDDLKDYEYIADVWTSSKKPDRERDGRHQYCACHQATDLKRESASRKPLGHATMRTIGGPGTVLADCALMNHSRPNLGADRCRAPIKPTILPEKRPSAIAILPPYGLCSIFALITCNTLSAKRP
jgi:hypothetical protein